MVAVGVGGGRAGIGAAVAVLGRWLGSENDRWVLWLPVAIGGGVSLYFALPAEPPVWVGLVAAVLSAVALMVFPAGRVGPQWIRPLAAIALALAAGFAAGQWRTALVQEVGLEKSLGTVTVNGRVARIEDRERGIRVVLQNVRISGLEPHLTPPSVRITLARADQEIWPGDWIRVTADVSPPPAPVAPGAFDFQRDLFFKGIGAVGFAFGQAEVTARDAPLALSSAAFWIGVETVRRGIAARIRDVLTGDAGHLAVALMTGQVGGISQGAMDDMRDSGLAHLLAISGLHVGLVAGIVLFSVRLALALIPVLALNAPIHKWAAAAAIVAAACYAVLAGGTVPTVRAVLMAGLLIAAVMIERRGITLRMVAWAAAAILLLKPESLMGASFQMSFAAVVALVAGYEAVRDRWPGMTARFGWPGRIALYVAGVGFTTLLAGTATAPFGVFHFNQFAVYSLLANLVAVPVTSLWIMPLCVVAFALMPFGLEALALTPMTVGLEAVLGVANAVAGLPSAAIPLPTPPDWAFAVFVLGGLWLCLWRRWPRLIGIGVMAAGLIGFGFAKTPDVLIDREARIAALYVEGGGLSFTPQTGQRFVRAAWLRRAGEPEETATPAHRAASRAANKPGANPATAGDWQCDGEGCMLHRRGRTVAVVWTLGALADECRTADVVINLGQRNAVCRGPVAVIGPAALAGLGAHALSIGPKGEIFIESDVGDRGQRPWVLRPDGRVR